MKSVLASLLPLALAVASCGGGSAPSGRATPSITPTTDTPGVGSSTPTIGSTPGQSTPPKIKGSSAPGSPTPGSPTPGGTGRLDLACARRGVDRQGLLVQTKPSGPVGYNTLYSDGSSNLDEGSNFKGGSGGGFADSTGRYRDSWLVPPNAPTGVTTVRVVAPNQFDLTFTIVAQNQSCP